MKKSSLLKTLEEAIKTEEMASAIFLKHLQALSSRFGLKAPFMNEFKKIVEFLITENKRHKKVCEDLYEKVKKVERNDI